MCIFKKPPDPKPLPSPPSKSETQTESLRRSQQAKVGGMTRQDTNVTGGSASGTPVYTPAAGGKLILGT